MFFLCAISTTNAKRIVKIIIILWSSLSIKYETKESEIEAEIAPKETKRKVKKTNKKMVRQIRAPKGLIPKIIPNEVATPLPPLNPA